MNPINVIGHYVFLIQHGFSVRKCSYLFFADTLAEIEKEKFPIFENGEVEDLSRKKKPAQCFVSSHD